MGAAVRPNRRQAGSNRYALRLMLAVGLEEPACRRLGRAAAPCIYTCSQPSRVISGI